jgi:transposase-like protein
MLHDFIANRNGEFRMATVKKMTSRRRWSNELDRESFWRKKLEEWQVSGLSVREFAKKHGLSEPRFYRWRREIWNLDIARGASGNTNSGPGTSGQQRTMNSVRRLAAREESSQPGFVPLSPAAENSAPPENTVEKQGLELHISRGSFIKVFHDSDFSLVSKLLTALEVAKC